MSEINQILVKELKKRNLKIASAESLTGGLISKKITEISGASEIFECGICSYSNQIKNQILGVRKETLEKFTEYSEQTAEEMAEGVRKLAKADIGIATTGIAGPTGGTEEKPVGTVYIGISSTLGTWAVKFDLGAESRNDRETIREISAIKALELALKTAEKFDEISIVK